jgi:hypothetical protein
LSSTTTPTRSTCWRRPWPGRAVASASARLRRPQLEIIVISALVDASGVAEREGLAFLPKPVDLDRLRRLVAEKLASGNGNFCT